MEYKIIEWELNDVIGELQRISLVSDPAIEQDFMLFNSVDLMFKTTDEEKRIVTGCAMRPDIKIMRKDENGDLYYGFFSKDTVRKAAEIFFKKNSNANNTNIEHQFEIDGAYVFESWIVENPELDKSKALGFNDVKLGDWWVSMKIENEDVWNNYLKTGLIKGFSVEIRATEKETEVLSKIKELLESDKSDDDKFDEIKNILS
jgi:hypothetical protein